MSFEDKIMPKDKYQSIILKSNGGYCVYYASNSFCNAEDPMKIASYHLDILQS